MDNKRVEQHPCPVGGCSAGAEWTNWSFDGGTATIEETHETINNGKWMADYQCSVEAVHHGRHPVPGPGW